MYKIIMLLATIDSVSTIQTLGNNLQFLGLFAATVSGNIDKFKKKLTKTTHSHWHNIRCLPHGLLPQVQALHPPPA
jgi:hypothetical protein